MNFKYFSRLYLDKYQVALSMFRIVNRPASYPRIAYEMREQFVRINVVLGLNFLSNWIADFKGGNPNRLPIPHGGIVEFAFECKMNR